MAVGIPACEGHSDIPHDDDIAFLTCVYMTDAAYDYKFEGGVRRSVDFSQTA